MGKVKFWSMKCEKEQSLLYEQESQPNKPRVYLIEGSQYSHVNSVANSKQVLVKGINSNTDFTSSYPHAELVIK